MHSPFALWFTLALAPLGAGGAVTVNYSAGLDESVLADSGGSPLDDGNAVRIGFFDTSFVAGGGLADLGLSDLATLEANFSLFDETTVTTLEFGSTTQPGSFAAEGSSTDAAFDGQKIYLWIFDTTDDAAPDATFSNVGEYGLFSSSDAGWSFPSQGDTFSTRTINTTEVDEIFLGEMDSANGQLLTAVPEPAQGGLLLALGAMAIAFTRRQGRIR